MPNTWIVLPEVTLTLGDGLIILLKSRDSGPDFKLESFRIFRGVLVGEDPTDYASWEITTTYGQTAELEQWFKTCSLFKGRTSQKGVLYWMNEEEDLKLTDQKEFLALTQALSVVGHYGNKEELKFDLPDTKILILVKKTS